MVRNRHPRVGGQVVPLEHGADRIQDVLDSAFHPFPIRQDSLIIRSTIGQVNSTEEDRSLVYADFVAPHMRSSLDCARRFVVADAYARFRREQGDAVLFATAVADTQAEGLRRMCELLDVSCDWDRSVVTSRPEFRDRAQDIFRALFEKGFVYRHESSPEGGGDEQPWLFRRARFAEACARGLDGLSDWTADAIEAQKTALGRIEGVEIDAVLLGGGQIPIFTPHPDAIADAAFVAISPHHREAETLVSPSDLEKLHDDRSVVKMSQTELQAAIPGVEGLIPVVVTPAVDARFGPTACLGIPNRDETDREIASRLESSAGGLPFKTATTGSKPRPAIRFRLPDRPLSRVGTGGIPVPIADCDSCGPVCVDAEESPACPKCGNPAKRDPQMIDGGFDGMWAWLSILNPTELDHWLPARKVVWSAPDGEQLLDERIAAMAASELDGLLALEPSEPFDGACLCGAVESGEELDEVIAHAGADAVRLTILHTASVSKATRWSPSTLRHSQRFLQELRDYAKPRLTSHERPLPLEIDRSSRLRRRLGAWCRIAEERISANVDELEMHKATYGLMLFFRRIRDFEGRCEEESGVTPLDQDAVISALLRFVRLAAPCIPQTAAELEALASD
jgi:leucyl-tRNA synthetase